MKSNSSFTPLNSATFFFFSLQPPLTTTTLLHQPFSEPTFLTSSPPALPTVFLGDRWLVQHGGRSAVPENRLALPGLAAALHQSGQLGHPSAPHKWLWHPAGHGSFKLIWFFFPLHAEDPPGSPQGGCCSQPIRGGGVKDT